MRGIAWSLLGLLITGWLLSKWDGQLPQLNPPAAAVSAAGGDGYEWRRTVDGWETRNDWELSAAEPPSSPTRVFHPLGLTTFLVIGSVASLFTLRP